MNSIWKLLLTVFVVTLGIFSCSPGPQATGPNQPGSGTEVVASLVNEDGSPAAGTTVYLRPSNYLPSVSAKIAAQRAVRTMDTTFTDSLGRFSFHTIAPGTYTLECLDGEPGNGALIDSVVIENPDSTIELATDTLKPVGSIMGQIQLPESLGASRVRVMIYGLDRVVTPDATGAYVISGLAQGTYSLRFQILGGEGQDFHNAAVTSGTVTTVPAALLPGADRIYAAKASGAITMDGVLDETDWGTANEISFSRPGYTENSVRVKTLWDATNLYVAYQVVDTLMGVDTTIDKFSDDAAEFYLDLGHDATDTMNADDFQIVVNIHSEFDIYASPTWDAVTGPITCKADTTSTGYTMEIAVPWAYLGKIPAAGLTMGALFANDDLDGNGYVQFDWLDLKTNPGGFSPWKNPSLWGDLILR